MGNIRIGILEYRNDGLIKIDLACKPHDSNTLFIVQLSFGPIGKELEYLYHVILSGYLKNLSMAGH